jgi:HD superfamily phosphohydrolase
MEQFRKCNEQKVLRDPIHGYIHVNDQIIWDLINAPEFQRLHRVHQLGGDFQVYHTAEHSRFAHSLGVYEIVRRMIDEVSDLKQSLSEFEKIQLLCAGLLHDLGHGPFSHLFENISHENHEERTISIILDPNTKVGQILLEAHPDLPKNIAAILSHTHENALLSSLISSQLDADRMDYLLRDAYETGTSYGTFDLERILRTMRVQNNTVCIKQSGMHSVEDYIMARYHMYWQVYLHPDAISYELLIRSFFKRYEQVRKETPIEALEIMYQADLDNASFYYLDESRLFYSFSLALQSEDKILADFADRILNRRLFDWILEPDQRQIVQVKEKLDEFGFEQEYYLYESTFVSSQNMPYFEEGEPPIYMLNLHNELVCLSACSAIATALLQMPKKSSSTLYFPKEIRNI